MTGTDRAKRVLEGPREMAEGIALQRYAESMLPEDERIFFDPLAVHFLDPGRLAWARDHPAETRAMVEELERSDAGLEQLHPRPGPVLRRCRGRRPHATASARWSSSGPATIRGRTASMP